VGGEAGEEGHQASLLFWRRAEVAFQQCASRVCELGAIHQGKKPGVLVRCEGRLQID
jgi:hypothetical protein